MQMLSILKINVTYPYTFINFLSLDTRMYNIQSFKPINIEILILRLEELIEIVYAGLTLRPLVLLRVKGVKKRVDAITHA